MFGKNKNKEGFKLNINKEDAEKEYEEYLNQPPEVLENLKMCKIFMSVFIPLGICLSTLLSTLVFNFKDYVGILLSLGICFLLGGVFFLVSKKRLNNWKLRLVPLICLCTGWIMGILCIQKIVLMFMNFAG